MRWVPLLPSNTAVLPSNTVVVLPSNISNVTSLQGVTKLVGDIIGRSILTSKIYTIGVCSWGKTWNNEMLLRKNNRVSVSIAANTYRVSYHIHLAGCCTIRTMSYLIALKQVKLSYCTKTGNTGKTGKTGKTFNTFNTWRY